MGLCFSKKKPPAKPGKIAVAVSDDKAKKPAPQRQQTKRAAAANKAAVFVVRPGSSAKDKDAAAAAAAPHGEDPKKKRSGSSQEPPAPKQLPVVLVPSAPVRTSSCTKEEVDAILIQCGRLSRSSSGAGTGRAASSSGETGGGGHRRRRSGSKRSYDFDQEAARAGGAGDEECDWERHGAAAAAVPVSRPSPHRGSPQRKRSGSRERSGGGGSGSRRASRSPGRRADSAATAGSGGGGDRARQQQQQQPGKMVSVPAREKGRAPSPAKRCASPRSSSPARMAASGNENAGGGGPAAGPTPVLSRSSSRKNEQSPYRRNPMAELDENSLRNNNNHSARPHKKSTETAVAATPKKAPGRGKEPAAAVTSSCSGKEKPEIAEDATAAAVAVAASETRAHSSSSKTNATRTVTTTVAESLTQRPAGAQQGCRSRRASRDFDQNPGSYTTQLLEDIHNYHQQSSTSATPPATPSFTLPACVAKACSIVDAVADLNSSSSENNRTCQSADDKGSVNAPAGTDDFVEPSAAARKHLVPPVREQDVRAETEGPQESAGSNSVSGHPWTPSWEPTSVESSDRTWSTGDEVVEQSGGSHGGRCSPMNRPRQTQSKQRQSQHEPSGGRSRAGSGNGNGNGLHRGRSAHRGSGSVASGRSGVRAVVSANSSG